MMTEHFTSDGKKFQIRKPTEADAASIILYSKLLFGSTDQVLTTPEEYTITIENEKVWIDNFNHNPNALLLIGEMDGEVIGLLFFSAGSKKKNAHTGEFGVSVHPKYQGLGIGRHLVAALLSWAKDHTEIEKVFLNVFATNINAIKLYKSLGFIEEGRHIKAVKQPSGTYTDVLQMYIETI